MILNKTAPCGASRPIAYYDVDIPRTTATLPETPMKKVIEYENDYGETRKYYKNIETPCGDVYQSSYSYGVLEVPLHSDEDPDKIVADQHHNLYLENDRKHRGAFEKNDPGLFDKINSWTDFNSGWKSSPVESGHFFEGYNDKGNDILTLVKIINTPPSTDSNSSYYNNQEELSSENDSYFSKDMDTESSNSYELSRTTTEIY